MLADTNFKFAPTPWHQPVLAYVDGRAVYAPLNPPPVRYRHPRTTFIVLH